MAQKKKYAQDFKDRMHEHEAMEPHAGSRGQGRQMRSWVEGRDPMVGRRDYAGMPPGSVMEEFPKSRALRGGYLDDTIMGIDDVIAHSEKTADTYVSNQK